MEAERRLVDRAAHDGIIQASTSQIHAEELKGQYVYSDISNQY